MSRLHVLAAIAVLTISGCSPAMEKEVSENGTEASLIAVIDGCNLWRVWDGGYVYFARCTEGAADVYWRRQSGKTTARVQTVSGNP